MDEQNSNYYELLELNPHDPWNEELFKKKLLAMQKQWSRESMGIDATALRARHNLDLIPDIKRVMSDKQLREHHTQQAKLTRGEIRQGRLIAFEHALAEKEVKGYLEERELQELAVAFQDVITEDDIIAQLNVPLRERQAELPEESQQLNETILQDIAEKLALLQMPNLYHLLAQPAHANLATLSAAAEQLFYEMMQRQPKTTEITIKMSLAGHAKLVFDTSLRRQQYDTYLAHQRQESGTQEAPTAPHAASMPPHQAPTPSHGSAEPPGSSPDTLQRLQALNLGHTLRLTWLWPTNCNEVIIAYSERAWPQLAQGIGKTMKVSRAYYEDRGGHIDLHLSPMQHYFLTATPIIWQAGKQSVAPETRVEAYLMPQASISYEIKNPRMGFKDRSLHLLIKPPAIIPTLLLVSKKNGLPLHKTDGDLLYREDGPLYITLAETIITLPNSPFARNSYARLFLEDDDLYSVIIIHHPHEKKLRLGK